MKKQNKTICTLKKFELFMNELEQALWAVVCSWCNRALAKGCKLISLHYLRKERVADFNKQLHNAVNFRMAHAMWSQRANTCMQRTVK